MAGPIFRRVGTRAQSASAATLTPTLPTVESAKGVLVCVVASKNNGVHATATTGWTKLAQQNQGANFTSSIFVAQEGVAAPVITWTGAVACQAQIAYYADPNSAVDATPGANSVSSGNASPHTSTAINTTRNLSDVIYVDQAAAQTGLATPAGWTENADAGSATDVGETTFGEKAVAVSGSSSGAISVAGAAADWVQWQIEIMQQAIASGLTSSKIEVAAWTKPLDGLASSKIEVGAWLVASAVRTPPPRTCRLVYLRQ